MEHRVLIVAGEDQDERVSEFSCQVEVAPYILYKRDEAKKLRESRLKALNEMKLHPEDYMVDEQYVDEEIAETLEGDDEDFFDFFTSAYEHDEDGNAISRMNPDGKFIAATRGGSFAQPFLLNDGTTSYSAKKSDINWIELHMNPEYINLYERTWEMCMEGLRPVSDMDKQVYNNMKDRIDYFEKFKDKEEYVTSCSSFWAFAFLNQADVWLDADDCPVSQFEWMSTYYDRFIKTLPDDTVLTIFEYIAN